NQKWDRFKDWKKIVSTLKGIHGNFEVMYVGQGVGSSAGVTDSDGIFRPFGQVDMTDKDFVAQFRNVKEVFSSELDYYLLWDHHYMDERHRRMSERHLMEVDSGRLNTKPVQKRSSLLERILG